MIFLLKEKRLLVEIKINDKLLKFFQKMDKIVYIYFQQNGSFLQKGKTNYSILGNFLRKFINDQNLKIIKKQNGKPEIISQKPFFFSIAHKKNYFLLAFSTYFPIGVDLEIASKKNSLSLAKRFFPKKEYELIKKDKNAQEKFYDLWTIKEAIYKLLSSSSQGNFFKILKQNITIFKKNLFIRKLLVGKKFFAHLVGIKKLTEEVKVTIRYL